MDRQLLAILVEPIKHDLGLTDTQIALLYGLGFSILYAVVSIPLARLSDRGYHTRIVTGSLVVFSTMTALCGLAGSYFHLLAARVGVGAGESGTLPACHAIIGAQVPPAERDRAFSLFVLGPHLGFICASLMGGLLATMLDWRKTFFIAGGVGLLLALATRTLKPSRTVATQLQKGLRESVLEIWRIPSMRHLIAGGTVINVANMALLGWLPAYLSRSHGFSTSAAGMLLALVLGVGGAGGVILGGELANRLGGRNPAWRLGMVVAGCVLAAPLWLAALSQPTGSLMYASLALGGFLISFHISPTFAAVQSLVPERSRAFGASILLLFANSIGLVAGPLLIGVLSDASQARHAAGSLKLALLVVPPIFLWAGWHYYRASRTFAGELQASRPGSQECAAEIR